ncbi:MAG: methyltransferase domain-containing protein [Microscillaceae bacterium]|nr:methyltransferase domain-containing protein [Microscillaceae bacterium]
MKKLKRVFEVLNNYGVRFLFKRVLSKIMRKRINNFAYVKQLFISKSGLEIGGPSGIFRDGGFIPLYNIVKELDGCNFSNITIWEGNIEGGKNYNYYNNQNGVQYISEATDLSLIPNSKYEFVISSNCLEHVANPLKAIEEWIRVIKEDGLVLIVVPNKKYCFDHNRPVTEFSHLLKDYQNNIAENDLTHLEEILELHDLKMDKPAGSLEQFRERSLKNFENRALHHHVFDIHVLKKIFNYFKLEVLLTHEGIEYIIIGKKIVA